MTQFLDPSQISTSDDIFDYLNDVWDLLPENDRFIFGETWKAYEQCYGNTWMKLMERRLSVNINNCPLYSDYRWLSFPFDDTTVLEIAASYESPQDFSQPTDLHQTFLVLISVNRQTPVLVNLQGKNPFATLSSEIVAALNLAFNFKFASTTDNGAIMSLTSNVAGPTSSITFYPVGSVFLTATLNANQSEIVVPSTAGLSVGMIVAGQYIETGTTIQEVVDATHVILTNDVLLTEGSASVSLSFYPPELAANDATALIFGLGITQLPLTVPEYPYAYALNDLNTAQAVLQDLTYTAAQPGSDGNLITVMYTDGATAGSEVVSIVGNVVTVQIESGVSTATQILTAFETYFFYNPTLNIISVAVSGTSTNAETAFPEPTPLQGGGNTGNTIVGIPSLQDTIHPELVAVKLAQDIDYTIGFGSGIIAFAKQPPALMWAPDTLKNQEIPYNNFGYLMGIYAPNTPAYLKAVRGLWYAFWTGPKPTNIQTSLYLLFGLPTASQAGTVMLASASQIILNYPDGTSETFAVPNGLTPIVLVGQDVVRFQPLVSGIKVYDKVNSPGFLAREVGRPGVDPFLTQYATVGPGPDTDETMALTLLEQNTYLPQIDVHSFISTDISLDNIDTFLKNIQPRSRAYLLEIVAANLLEELSFEEEIDFSIDMDVTPNLDMNPNTRAQQSDLTDAETDPDSGIVLDCDGFTTFDLIDVAVYQGVTLIDSFRITG